MTQTFWNYFLAIIAGLCLYEAIRVQQGLPKMFESIMLVEWHPVTYVAMHYGGALTLSLILLINLVSGIQKAFSDD